MTVMVPEQGQLVRARNRRWSVLEVSPSILPPPDGERIGLDLILPLASMLPFERHVKWVEEKNVGANVAQELLVAVGPMALMLLGRAKFVQAIPGLADLLKNKKVGAAMLAGAKLAGDQLKRTKTEALEKNDYMAATLAEFRIALQHAEGDRILIRSKK